jgi:hypothetical protein
MMHRRLRRTALLAGIAAVILTFSPSAQARVLAVADFSSDAQGFQIGVDSCTITPTPTIAGGHVAAGGDPGGAMQARISVLAGLLGACSIRFSNSSAPLPIAPGVSGIGTLTAELRYRIEQTGLAIGTRVPFFPTGETLTRTMVFNGEFLMSGTTNRASADGVWRTSSASKPVNVQDAYAAFDLTFGIDVPIAAALQTVTLTIDNVTISDDS